MNHSDSLIEFNPFATRWVRPGAIAFQFADGAGVASLVEKLRAARWWGEIVGPHGSGKSTLLATLVPAIEQAGRRVTIFELHDGQRSLGVRLSTIGCDAESLVVVDGYEQLSWWNTWRLRWYLRRHGAGLVVTTHRPTGLPLLCETQSSLELAQRLVAQLTGAHPSCISAHDLSNAYQACHGDLRETFFRLYDLHEARKRESQT